MINSMMEYGSAISYVTDDEFKALTMVHDRQVFDEPRSALCGANQWGTSHPDLVTCPSCKSLAAKLSLYQGA
jgi:hypothetical protein